MKSLVKVRPYHPKPYCGDAAVSTAAGTKLLGELIDRYRKKKYESLTGRQ
jgi:hypothetical protein